MGFAVWLLPRRVHLNIFAFPGERVQVLLQFSVEVSGPILGKVVKERMLTPPVSM